MEPIDYGGVLLRRWWLPVVLGVICAVAAVLTHSRSLKAFGCQGSRFLGEVDDVCGRRSPTSS